ncbi:Hpt domain-containing protein [Massilia sp. PAMC28688]|uniref:Hpt domain-containing protein n=1 Tax=Massilia sp. PAMC28688 TaxID=2861283 RepID=UPI001C62FF94|nr:Hpt domain-containing protein [Massilia sp. PAMC28688]QYF93221.1 Hpt domain-containing protein [Massilia sp. PAMC28688]
MAAPIDQEFFARLRALNDKFAAGVPATLQRLRAQRAAINPQAPDRTSVTALQETLHTIAGSAATFGFRSFGQQARALEQRLRVLTAFDAVAPRDWDDWLASLDAYIAWAEIDPKAEDGAGSPPAQ